MSKSTSGTHLLTIDADGHYFEDVAGWASMLPAGRREWLPKVAVESDGVERFTIGDLWVLPSRSSAVNQMGGMTPADGLTPRTKGAKGSHIKQRRFHEAHPGGMDPKARLALMRDEGIAVSVLYPTLALAAIPGIKDATAASYLAAALNDWLVERFCSVDPTRLVPVATVPLHDPAFAAAELERCVKQLGMRAAWVAPSPTMGRNIDDPANDVVWKTAADLGIAMTTHHGSGGGGLQALGRERNKTWLGAHSMGHAFEAMAAIVGLYTSRVFHRYPSLRWGFMEAGCGWLAFWLHQIHEHAERMAELVPGDPLPDDLRDIFRARCILSAEADEPFVNNALDAGGERSLVWASDYPHFDCELPDLAGDMRERGDLTPARREAVLSRNAIAFFELAERIEKVTRSTAAP